MRILISMLLALVSVAAACGGETVTAGVPAAATDPVGAWVLTGGTVDEAPVSPLPGWDVTLTIEADGSVGGTAACNGYGGEATFDGEGTLSFGQLAQTEMACEPQIMDLEQQFLGALLLVDGYEVGDGTLRLTGDGVDVSFDAVTPVPEADLVGTRWVLDTRFEGETASTTRGEATLQLNEDGTFRATTGCRTLTGEWQTFGGRLQFPSMGADGECGAELEEQDGFVISVLEGPLTVEIDGPVLRLTAPGDEGLGYRAEGG